MRGSRVLIDTNVATRLFKGDRPLSRFMAKNHMHMSSITRMELLAWRELDESGRSALTDFIGRFELIRPEGAIEEIAIGLLREYRLDIPDALIAAKAISEDMFLMSEDKAFRRIKKGLKLIQPDR